MATKQVDPEMAEGMERIAKLDRILGKRTETAERVANKVRTPASHWPTAGIFPR